jgi:hypothetical protein
LLTTAAGKVYAFGNAQLFTQSGGGPNFGGLPNFVRYPACNDPTDIAAGTHAAFLSTSGVAILGIAGTGNGLGYWLVSPTGKNDPTVATVPDALVAISGVRNGVDCGTANISVNLGFGDAKQTRYAMNALPALSNVVGYGTTPRASGLWIVASDGGVFAPK